jgi:DNA mismatch repair protein MutL
MSSISVLPEILINKIAAGEVIERPAAVVRELIDNSIDAGAKTISIIVLYGGKKLIRVDDDGIGMNRNDAVLCFERHATSKIKSEEDLFNITTMGFRGEALPSVASVSKISLVTSTANSASGTKIEIGAGQKKEVSDAPPLSGTVVEVRDLFYNTPARQKFLKSTSTELSHIVDTVTQKALAYPEIAFSLKHSNNEIINAPASKDIKERFKQLYGEELFNEFLEINPMRETISNGVKKQGAGIKLYGFSSNAEFARASRSYQFIFINRRSVKNPTVSHAVYSVYKDLIPKDRHPAFFLFLDIDPKKVDVNVHPAKREVRFETPSEIHDLVSRVVRDALCPQKDDSKVQHLTSASGAGITYVQGHQGYNDLSVRETLEKAFQVPGSEQSDFFRTAVSQGICEYFYIADSFVASASNSGLTIIDQHAAHERILYEKFLKKTFIETEPLFIPIRIELPAKEYNAVLNYLDIIRGFGLDIENFGINNVIVRAMPKELGKTDIKGILMDIVSGIIEEETTGIKDEEAQHRLLKNIAARLACHKSVRGKERLNNEELSQMAAELEKTAVPDKCPHGRPTRIFFSLDDLMRMFKRK